MAGNQPVATFKHGSVEAAIFENEVKKNGKSFTVRKVVVQRNYLDRNEQWQSTSSLEVNDVPKAVLVLSKAYDFMTVRERPGTGNQRHEELLK